MFRLICFSPKLEYVAQHPQAAALSFSSLGLNPLTALDQVSVPMKTYYFLTFDKRLNRCFPATFDLYISYRCKWRIFQRKMWQANPGRAAFLAQWAPARPTLPGIWKCWQVNLVYIIICVHCSVSLSPPESSLQSGFIKDAAKQISS